MEFEMILALLSISFVCINAIEDIDIDYLNARQFNDAVEPRENTQLDIFSRLLRNAPIVHENANNKVLLSGSKQNIDNVKPLSLRSASDIGCASEIGALYCTLRCGKERARCSTSGACYCLYLPEQDKKVYIDNTRINEYVLKRNHRTEHALRNSDPEIKDDVRPILRHHIAHFCPNVELARSCIRKCMKQGKPSFCGKDHKCYCGHRYTQDDRDNKDDADDIYAEFKDLYVKYFGPGYQEVVEVK